MQPQDTPGMQGWHWEVAVTYADIMADLCLHGTTSSIQKVALVGTNKDVSNIHQMAAQPACPMRSAGLLDLLHFRAVAETQDASRSLLGDRNVTSWQIKQPESAAIFMCVATRYQWMELEGALQCYARVGQNLSLLCWWQDQGRHENCSMECPGQCTLPGEGHSSAGGSENRKGELHSSRLFAWTKQILVKKHLLSTCCSDGQNFPQM